MKKQEFNKLSSECKSYRTAINKCMVTMLLFYGLFAALIEVYRIVGRFLYTVLPTTAAEIWVDVIYGCVYIISFVVPVFLFKLVYPKHETFPLEAEPRVPRGALRLTFASVGITFSAAMVSGLIMMLIEMLTHRSLDLPESEMTGAHSVILSFILTGLIPAFVEELLFRGVFLRNLLPYGKTTAIVVSSLMFAMMHQNFYQFFYTFVGGMAFGYLFIRTGSIWYSVLAHMINNTLSVLTSDVATAFLNETAALQLQYAVYIAVMLVAFLCFVSLAVEKKRNSALKKGSVFGSTEKVYMPSGTIRVSDSDAVKHFFTPATIAVIVIAVAEGLYFIIKWCVPIE